MLLHTVKQSISPKRVVILGATGVIGKALVSYLKDRGEIVVEIGSRDLELLRDDAPERLAGRLFRMTQMVVLAGIARRGGSGNNGEECADGQAYLRCIDPEACCTCPLHEFRCCIPFNGGRVGIQPDGAFRSLSAMHLERERLFLGIAHCPVAMLRSTQVCAPHDTHDAYGPSRFIRTARQENRIVLFGQGEETRDHIMVEDVAAVIHGCLLHRSRGVRTWPRDGRWFCGGCPSCGRSMRSKPTIEYAPRQMPITHRRFDASAVGLAFPGFSFTTIEDGLASMMRQTIAAKSC